MKLFPVFVLVFTGAACTSGYAVGRYRTSSDCEKWADSSAVVHARVVSFGTTRELTLGGQSGVLAAPMRLLVIESFKGALTGQVDTLMGNGLAPNGDSENGNMTGAEGLFWLRTVDGQLVFAGSRFFRLEPGGFRRQYTSTPSDGILTRDRLRELEASCPLELDGGSSTLDDGGVAADGGR